jgi:hypothetical protein
VHVWGRKSRLSVIKNRKSFHLVRVLSRQWRFINFRMHRSAIGKIRVSPLLSLNTSTVIRYLICVSTRQISSPEDRITSIKHCAPRISSKMAAIDEFVLKNIGLWWRYGISRHCDEWKYIIIGRIFESEIILISPPLRISESSSNGSYRNTDEVWWRYEISRSCDECTVPIIADHEISSPT